MKNQTLHNDNFFRRVYAVTKQIPCGRVTTYGAIARFLGSSRSARVVGWALNTTFSIPGFIPAHRVVNRNGQLTGKKYFGSPYLMQQLLENEGIRVENDCIVDFAYHYWDPSEYLKYEDFCLH